MATLSWTSQPDNFFKLDCLDYFAKTLLGKKFNVDTCSWKPEAKSLDAKTAPAFRKLLRHEAKFSADWAISGMSAAFFNWTVFHKSDVIELMADSEVTYENDV